MAMSDRIEDYLEEIFSIEISGDKPTVTALAKRLDVSKASVVSALRRLCSEGYLEQEKYCTPVLTSSGRSKALKIFRRHKHLSFLLREIIGIKPELSEDIACAMEHALDNDSEKRLAAFVDFYCKSRAEKCDWITRMEDNLENPEELVQPLLMVGNDQDAQVVRITASNLLRNRLKDSGFVHGACLKILSCDFQERMLEVELEGQDAVLSMTEAMTVWVLPEK